VVNTDSTIDSPKDPRNQSYGAFKEKRYQSMISDDLEPIAKGTWSAKKDDKTNWAAAYRRYGAAKMCCVAMMYVCFPSYIQLSSLRRFSYNDPFEQPRASETT
jgi:hypothetical protein